MATGVRIFDCGEDVCSVKFIPFMVLSREVCIGNNCDTIWDIVVWDTSKSFLRDFRVRKKVLLKIFANSLHVLV